MFSFIFDLLEFQKKRKQKKKKNAVSKDVHGKMIDLMMLGTHAIVNSDELESRHMQVFRRVDRVLRNWLLEKNKKGRDIFDLTVNLEDHYTNLYGPDLVTEAQNKESGSSNEG